MDWRFLGLWNSNERARTFHQDTTSGHGSVIKLPQYNGHNNDLLRRSDYLEQYRFHPLRANSVPWRDFNLYFRNQYDSSFQSRPVSLNSALWSPDVGLSKILHSLRRNASTSSISQAKQNSNIGRCHSMVTFDRLNQKNSKWLDSSLSPNLTYYNCHGRPMRNTKFSGLLCYIEF